VCGPANLELVRSLGADVVIDYTREDFTRNGEAYDLIMDTAGTAPWSRSKGSLRPGGRLLVVLGSLGANLASIWVNATTNKKVVAGVARALPDEVRLLGELAAAGIYRPVIDRTYPLERIAEAHAHVDTGHKKGNVVITVGGSI
jgi:NADPH:quinone reductase-like Zn-dependent oxidoreductase